MNAPKKKYILKKISGPQKYFWYMSTAEQTNKENCINWYSIRECLTVFAHDKYFY